MNHIQSFWLNEQNREEQIPGFDSDFPYVASRAELDKYTVPWHWHRAVELFIVESGCLEYITPCGHHVFPAGSGGFVNSNVLHSSHVVPTGKATVQLLHLFDPSLISGNHDSRIYQKYILPMTTSSTTILPLYPQNPDDAKILEQIFQTFSLSTDQSGYEIQLRNALSTVWIDLLPRFTTVSQHRYSNDTQIKALMAYIHDHFQEPISIEELAQSAHISRRLCFRLFQNNLHMTPVAYIRSYRLQRACRMLHSTDMSVTDIAYACGLGSSSYLSKLFRQEYGCTPHEYRKRHNCNI